MTDQAGTPRELCDEQGRIIWRGEQHLWGGFEQRHLQGKHKRYLEDAANDPVECELRYQGQIYDKETGLYYNRHRYYDTDSGQYLSSDPIGFAGGLRPQAYVHNPMDWMDPLGLAPDVCRKADRKRRYHSSSAEYMKHTKARTCEEAKKMSSNGGAAQYWNEATSGHRTSKEVTSFRNQIEKEALSKGSHLSRSGGSDFYIYDAKRNIGFNNGKATQYMRVEVTKSTNEFHGHPISLSDYNTYMKGVL